MKISLPSEKTITVRKKTLTTSELEVFKIVETPEKKVVAVSIKGLGRVKIKTLSGTNYDSPPWTNESLAAAVLEQFSA